MSHRRLFGLVTAVLSAELIWLGLCVGLDASNPLYHEFSDVAPGWVWSLVLCGPGLALAAAGVHRMREARSTRSFVAASALATGAFASVCTLFAGQFGLFQTSLLMYGGAAVLSASLAAYGTGSRRTEDA